MKFIMPYRCEAILETDKYHSYTFSPVVKFTDAPYDNQQINLTFSKEQKNIPVFKVGRIYCFEAECEPIEQGKEEENLPPSMRID